MLNIWLINPYGPIPGEGWRDYRFKLIGDVLSEGGHQVTWWTANFSHHFKKYRSEGWRDLVIRPGFIIRLTPTTGYKQNISLGRLRFELNFVRNVKWRGFSEAAPDCIISVDPPQIVGKAAVELAGGFKARLIIDVMDLWPELFVLALPKYLRPLAPAIFSPFYSMRRHNLNRANVITSLSPSYLEIAKAQIDNSSAVTSSIIYNGIDVDEFRKNLERVGLREERSTYLKRPDDVWVIFAGSLGDNYDILTILQAAMILGKSHNNIKIIIAGDGPYRSRVEKFVIDYPDIPLIYLGTLSPADLAIFYAQCDIGLAAYGPRTNVAMPDKAYDYLAAGLVIVNSLKGDLATFLSNHKAGVQYPAGNPDALANRLIHLAEDIEQRQIMAKNAYQTAEFFDSRSQFIKFIDLVKQ